MLLYYLRKDQKPKILLLSALAGALAVLTSAVALVFLLPFALYATVALWRRLGLGRMLLWVLAAYSHFGCNQWGVSPAESVGV